MVADSKIKIYDAPNGIAVSETFLAQVRSLGSTTWSTLSTYAVDVADVNTKRNEFNKHPISLASFDFEGLVEIRAKYSTGKVHRALVRPASLGVQVSLNDDNTVSFTLDHPKDVMLEVNGDKWEALHVLTNKIEPDSLTRDTENIWYFGPGVNNGSAYARVTDGNLRVPSNTTVYLAGGAFLTARLEFINVSNSAVRGPGFIYHGPNGAILIERSTNVTVQNVTSLGATGFSLTTGEAKGVHIDRYRSFSSHGNGDGIDLFCSSDVTVENCFLRNSDDTIAIYGHRWDYYGDTSNIAIRNCTVLPDIAHPIHMGTHGNADSASGECFSNIHVSNIDILDHYENQLWYQGCISVNAGDKNLIEKVHFEDIRVEKISKGQLVNLRVMKNAMWTTAPGRGVRDITFKNVTLGMENSGVVNPSQILGYDRTRKVENISFENLKVGNEYIHENMEKPRWYMVADFVPMFINEHTSNIRFTVSE
ncbi:tat pathway signal sequence domain [Fusarium albosuccineum]|uniref:Tat pathway signal sequence domain n=1 Tax=Fusarium albosuccineum TaxID=1237068 RepID=A0A8H4L1L6_9HYPO|nr:tat pathway signal sequence domain [Fusarium albosuccineum]